MQLTKFRVLSAIATGSLALAVVATTASSGTSPAPKHAALAAQTESSQAVNLDNCPILYTGYPAGGCVTQLQTDLNSIPGNNLTVDGTFGSQTYDAVIAFQQAHGLPQDGLVGPATKQALEAVLPGDSVPSPTVPPATVTAPAPSAPVPGTSGGSPVTINCGYITCSAYLSRSVTRAAYQKSTVGGAGYLAMAGVICGALAIPPLTPVGVACGAAATFQGGWIAQELGEAATLHGAEGACLKVTYTIPTSAIPPTITWWSTNNGQYCKD